jgi:hypothetical protein
LINGSDAKYLKDVSYDDEYQLSSFIPEKLCRHNRILGNFITSHLSYSFQNKIILKDDVIYNKYLKIKDLYISRNIDPDIPRNIVNHLEKIHHYNNIFKVKNWFQSNFFYIKDLENNQYLYIDYEEDILKVSDHKCEKTIFEINTIKDNIITINLGIYFLTRYNCHSTIRNENIFLKTFYDENEKYIRVTEENHLKFLKYNHLLEINHINRWSFEKVLDSHDEEYLYLSRIIKKNKIYYKDIKTDEIYTNYYSGWSLNI